MHSIPIVYQHSDFIVIDKPTNISVHKDAEKIGLTSLVAQQLNVPQVWLVHRLDKVTSGLLILALNQNAASELSRLFAEHRIQKTYLALSTQKPKKKQGLIIGDMEKARRGAWKLCTTKQNPAITRFYSVNCEPNLRLFILKPQTGKTHQLRVAMKSLGSPILGDALYGGNFDKVNRTYLHAYRLQFEYKGQFFDIQYLPKSGSFFQRNSVQAQFEQLTSV
ncbi:RNA pseudouridine synthase [Pasteurella multocida]|uniref:Pseudouridine synthase Rlu family protein, TIGR01621 n=1 Tax=Pasteurella dagmatis ATCC 43325 TaxID=667128 RepID=C9PQV5_9PAST|nr:TIGR01621 family pseudouridine synthase [Pasteurella dagmatis]EEX49856.1 pseudouridine synthase Rlu family protein, TIGR01621 [Pasteurella dagmatis ATCC 43325]SNV59855.1 RNA pseudouridine synthase [Pasteurella dagmatis]VEI57772.1 RNA pseudouridine synthase [Pasteurella multocida]